MGRTFKSILISTAALGLTLTASAQAIGSIDAMSSETGSVIVTRGGSTYSLAAGDPIFEGDRITTRSNGAITITANGCTVSLEAESSTVVNDAFCNVEVVTLSAETGVSSTEVSAGSFELVGGNRQTLNMVGGFGSIGIMAVAASSGSKPTSP